MIKKNSVFDFLASILMIFGFTVLFLAVFCVIFGEEARDFSTIFSLGSEGIGVATLFQFLMVAVAVSLFKWIFFTDALIKNCSIPLRTIAMFLSVIIMMVICIVLFGWFPVNMVEPWIAFFISFFASTFVSVVLSLIKEKTENDKMQEMLEKLKDEEM